ncbi:MAG: hypothetical protein A4E40_00504 [Methanoregulaceae archaeon PtaU1.Bin059]|nr:MAG: hypothetical protein A4E40_00504 [Methanoregulaceae archaeon PtaU1.Bin059]
MTLPDPATFLITSTSDSGILAMTATRGSPKNPCPAATCGVTMRVSPTSLMRFATRRLMLWPRIPMEAIASTPMIIPRIARNERTQ